MAIGMRSAVNPLQRNDLTAAARAFPEDEQRPFNPKAGSRFRFAMDYSGKPKVYKYICFKTCHWFGHGAFCKPWVVTLRVS